MKVLVKAYTVLNLGDDLFLDILLKRYPNVDFGIETFFPQKYEEFLNKYPNAHFAKSESILYKVKRKLGISRVNFNKSRFRKLDAIIYIGGSIFMENENDNSLDIQMKKEVDYAFKKGIPYYILSCNFGPYKSQEYIDGKIEVFKKCKDICFRDKKSYEMFKNLKNVRCSLDAVFCGDFPEIVKEDKSIGISLIDITNRKHLSKYKQSYMDFLEKVAREHLEKGYKLTLFNFCEFEGDKAASEELYQRLIDCKELVRVVTYNGDIENFLKEFAKNEKMVCTRFHSMILSVILGQEFLPVVYSEKIENVINDMDLCSSFYRIGANAAPVRPFTKAVINHDLKKSVFDQLDKLLK